MRAMQMRERSSKRNDKAAPLLEWQTCESDAEWQALPQNGLATSIPQPDTARQPFWGMLHWRLGAATLLMLAATGVWIWSVAQRGVAQIEADLRESVEVELWKKPSEDGQEIDERSLVGQLDGARPYSSSVQLQAIVGETAIVQVVTQLERDLPALRQTRFYRQTADGPLRTKPNAELWGSPHRLETSHFAFHFRQYDAQVVAAVAPKINALYTEVGNNLGLIANAQKLVIEVSVEQVTGDTFTQHWDDEPLVVPSPAVYLAPAGLSDRELLEQSIALPLIDYMGTRAIEDHAIPVRWQPLLLGLRLWQLWDLDMPLAHWRHAVVSSLYMDAATGPMASQYVLPNHDKELCAAHSLWVLSPIMIGVPFECHISDEGRWVAKKKTARGPLIHIDQLRPPLKGYDQYYYNENYFFDPTEVVAIATLIEYIVATYGHEELPVLLASLTQYEDWERLIPALFDLSASDFEANWHSYLTQQYGVTLDH